MNKPLHQQHCVPCEGGTKPLDAKAISIYLRDISSHWQALDNKLQANFKFKDFVQTMAFVNRIADIAQAQGHHPDLCIHYSKVDITLWTHAIGGLSLNDFILAAKIDHLKRVS